MLSELLLSRNLVLNRFGVIMSSNCQVRMTVMPLGLLMKQANYLDIVSEVFSGGPYPVSYKRIKSSLLLGSSPIPGWCSTPW